MRREQVVRIERDGRDAGKEFLLTEMSAIRAEKWAMRAMLALSRSRPDVPPEVVTGGLAALVTFGLRMLSGLQFAEAEPLMDEMLLACVKRIPDPNRPKVRRDLTEDDIEEISTLVRVRAELLSLHTGFSLPVALLTSITDRATGALTSATPTSPTPSDA